MSSMINIGPMIAKVTRDMLMSGTILDVENVYLKLVEVYGDQVFESERMLAQVAVRQKIKSHLKSAHSINGDGDADQLSLIKDDAPATLAVKQKDGGYAYVPLLKATIGDLDAATSAKRKNIANAEASLDRWIKTTKTIRATMKRQGVTFGEAQLLIAEQQKQKAQIKPRKRKAS